WRHSFTATYWLYDMHSKKFLNSDIPPEVQYFSWAPVGDKMAFVWNNDLFVKINGTTPPVAVTDTGEENVIFNGIPDWVYEGAAGVGIPSHTDLLPEEMFSSGQGLWWSPGGKRVAYVQTNDTEVHHIEYSWYGQGQYPQTVSIPYPKAGTPNPVVKLFVVDTDNAMRVSEVVVPDSFGSTEHYLATVTWLTDERIAVQWLKRVQQHLILQIYNFNGSRWDPVEVKPCAQNIFMFSSQRLEVNSESGWIGRFSPAEPVFDPDGSSYYLVMSDASGYKHLHRVVKGKSEAVTSGQWEVVDILKVTEDSVYYSSNEDGERPGGRNVYRLTKDNVKTCLTCSVNQERCQYNSASFSQNASFYLLGCRGPGIPYYSLMDTFKNTEVKYLENNDKFSSLIAGIEMPTVLTDSIDLYGFKLWYKMVLPPGFDRSKKYPLLIDVYAGPCSQKVNSVYQVSWATYLASTEKIIVASFDGRGSGFQGDKLMHTIYKRLGTYEVEDQITAAKEFIKMGFVDKDRIAIWGWSYGGYVTSMALGSGSGVFSCGMAVAPVSKWDYYGNFCHFPAFPGLMYRVCNYGALYCRFHLHRALHDGAFGELSGLPREFRSGGEAAGFFGSDKPFSVTKRTNCVQNSTVTERAKNFHSVKYLLVHGTADDNVHFQQAAEISEALVEEQVDFEAMWYTDKDHALSDSAYQHVYTHMTHFLLRCFA
ncbi:unnamed protein product, partial [Tetraodon nigroviridis]